MALDIGSPAPDFTLYSDEKKKVSLSDYRGKNLIINFFPAAFTGVCTAQLCDARDNFNKYQSLNAEVVGISIDTPFTLSVFKEMNQYNFPLLSDFNKKTIADYDVFFEKFPYNMTGVAARAVFIIDTEGVIRYKEVLANPGELPNFAALRDALASLN